MKKAVLKENELYSGEAGGVKWSYERKEKNSDTDKHDETWSTASSTSKIPIGYLSNFQHQIGDLSHKFQ